MQTDQELSDALTNPDYFNPLTIQIVQRTYTISGSGGTPANTTLLGGYTQDCVSRQVASGNTVLTASAGQSLEFILHGNLAVEGLTFELPYGLYLEATSSFFSGSQILISRSTFTGGTGLYVQYSPLNEDDTGGVRIVDSLFVGSATSYDCVLSLIARTGFQQYDLTSNTVMNNPNTALGGVCLVNYTLANGVTLYAHDNIFFGNGGADLYSNSPDLELVDNIIGVRDTRHPTSATSAAQCRSKLDANYRPITSPLSPAINSGETANGYLPATDLDGGPRIVGSKVDRGAYESGIDDNSLLLSVTNANNSGAGSLREAIISANLSSSFNIINFAIGSVCGRTSLRCSRPCRRSGHRRTSMATRS